MSRLYPPSLVCLVALTAGCGGAARRGTTGADTETRVRDRTAVSREAERTTQSRQGDWSLTTNKVQEVAPFVARAARDYRLPPDLIYGVIWVESRFNSRAVSPVGARGLMQLMPKTARYLADCIAWRGRADPFDPEFNIAAGSYYIARLIEQFNGDQDLALAAYNAGPANVRRWVSQSGLPEVSVEYHTMVQTARSFFADHMRTRSPSTASGSSAPAPAPDVTDGDLDRLGLAILIAGLDDKRFGLDRPDDAHPFD